MDTKPCATFDWLDHHHIATAPDLPRKIGTPPKSGAFLIWFASIAYLLSVVARGEKVADSVRLPSSRLISVQQASAAAAGWEKEMKEEEEVEADCRSYANHDPPSLRSLRESRL